MQMPYFQLIIVKILKPLWIKKYYKHNLIPFGING